MSRFTLHDCLVSIAFLAISPLAFCQQGTIAGIVADSRGAAVARAQVKLTLDGRGSDRETQSAEEGQFSFSNVAPGPYRLSFSAEGFAVKTIAGELHAGESLNLPRTVLTVATLTTEVNVTQTQAEIAQEQIKAQEQQRFIGLVPNYFVNYDRDAAPLTAKQKFELTWKTFLDPSAFVINGIIAGVGQAQDTHKGFGQGAQGYGKRYGASYADFVTSVMLDKVVMPSVFKQDPRYFYKGSGSKGSRFFYAMSRSVICRGDNKKDQFCYSSFINRFGSGFLTNRYYPAADRDKAGVIVQNAAIGIGAEALGNLFQEFIARKLTRKKP